MEICKTCNQEFKDRRNPLEGYNRPETVIRTGCETDRRSKRAQEVRFKHVKNFGIPEREAGGRRDSDHNAQTWRLAHE